MMRWYAIALICIFAACSVNDDPEHVQSEQTREILSEINAQLGMPNIKNFKQKRTMRMILEECDRENVICYAYIVAEYSGKLIFIGKCVGYGVPFSAQYTNPMKAVDDPFGNYNSGSVVLPQADPNGLYMPSSSSATWLLLIDPKTNRPRVVYIEPQIIVSPFPLHDE